MEKEWIPNFLLGIEEPPEPVAEMQIEEAEHVRWYRLRRRVPMGDKQINTEGMPAPRAEVDGRLMTTLTIRPREAWIRYDYTDLGAPARCAVNRDGEVVFVSEEEGYRAAGRNPASAPWWREEMQRHQDEARWAREVLAASEARRAAQREAGCALPTPEESSP